MKPPKIEAKFFAKIKENFFSSPLNSLATLIILGVLIYVIPQLFSWLIFNAVWTGTVDACKVSINGACWAFIADKIPQLIYGFYPNDQRWRITFLLIVLVIGVLWLVFEKTRYKKQVVIFLLFIYPVIALILLKGGVFGLESVGTKKWGGLTLTLIVSITGIVLSFPIGVLLALGRRSEMPFISAFCTIFIEFWRGVPLITVLFMAAVMFPLFMPEGFNLNDLLRSLIGVIIFTAAYLAETIRGGLQALPKGQYEAADALGLSFFQKTRQIILPQALKIVIPGLVNSFISLFKDTTLVSIIGLFDFLGVLQAVQSDWLTHSVPYTAYAFGAMVFFLFCFSMSAYSKSLEAKLNTGHKK